MSKLSDDQWMRGKLIKPVSGALADILVDVVSYAQDISNATQALRRTPTADPDLRSILWDYAVVKYGRVFGGGVRTPFDISAYINSLSAENRATHEQILFERNKHVAHSVSNREGGTVAFLLSDPNVTGTREYLDTVTMDARLIPLQAAVAPFLALLTEAEDAFDEARRTALSAIDSALRQEPLDALYAVPNLAVGGTSRPQRKSPPRRK